MRYTILHELPKRIRIQLQLPLSLRYDISSFEEECSSITGVERVKLNPIRKTLLVHYNGKKESKESLLETIQNISYLPLADKSSRPETEKELSKNSLYLSGGLLLARPFIPAPIRTFLMIKAAIPVIKKGIASIYQRKANAELLDATAVSVAMAMKEFKTVSVICFLLKVSEYLENWAKQKSHQSLTECFSLFSGKVWVIREGKEQEIAFDQLIIGDQVIIHAGNSIPVDGLVLEGEALVNQSTMTGEPLGTAKRVGSPVYAGTTVEEGSIVIRATNVGAGTKISQIIKTIEESELLKADVQSKAEQLADKLVPWSFLLSGLTYMLTGNLTKAASALLVDFSCAIKLSTPLTIMSSMLEASKQGIFIKGGKYIEILSNADAFVFDKTGTLTEARPQVLNIIPLNGYSREYLLKNVACVEEHFPHPVANAIVQKAAEEGLFHEENHSKVKHVVAHGIESEIDGKRITVGSRHFIEDDRKIDTSIAEEHIYDFQKNGNSVLYIAIADELVGVIGIEDPIRREAKSFLENLKENGSDRMIMLTGDHEAPARKVAEKLGLTEYRAQIFPEDKMQVVQDLKRSGHTVVMVGDGMNDSPALSYADLGVTLQQASDIAKETSNVILLKDDLQTLNHAITISKKAMNRIQQNYNYIMRINSSLILLGVFGVVPPVFSAFMHNATTVFVAGNALRQ